MSSRRDVGDAMSAAGVGGEHAGFDVVGDVAVEQPGACVVGDHVGDDHGGGQQRHDVGAHPVEGDSVAVPVGSGEVDLAAHTHEVPAHVLAVAHAAPGEVPEDVAVAGGNLVAVHKVLAV